MPELDLPPDSMRDKLPNQDESGELFSAGGWSALLTPGVDLNWDQPRTNKPQMVQDDNEQARREGFRER